MDISSLQILCIEDNLVGWALLRDALEQFPAVDFFLTRTSCLKEAAPLAAGTDFDAVIFNSSLLTGKGRDDLRALQQSFPSTPILTYSGLEHDSFSLQSIQEGDDDSLSRKGSGSCVLADVLRYAVEHQRHARLGAVQSQLAAVVEYSNEAIFSLDLSGIITTWNHGAETLYGYAAEEAIGQPYGLIFPPDHMAEKEDILAHLRRGEKYRDDETLRRRSDGRLVDVAISLSPMYDANGALTGASVTGRDVSTQKAAHEASARSEKLYRAIASNFPNGGVYLIDPEGRVFLAEGRGLGTVGLAREDLVGKTIEEGFGHTSIYPIVSMTHQRALNGEETAAEFEIGGRYRSVRVVPVYNDEHQVAYAMAMTQDITDSKRAQEELQKKSNEIVTIWESMTDAFYALDSEWRFVYVNSQAEILLERDRKDLLGKGIWEEFPEAAGMIFYREYRRAVTEQVEVAFDAYYPPLKFWAEVHAYPSPVGLSVYFRDISARKKNESELRKSQARFQSLMANVPGTVYQLVMHPGGRMEIPFVSEGCRELFELEPTELQEDTTLLAETIHPSEREEWRASVRESARNLTPWSWEGRINVPSGKNKWIQGASRPKRLTDGGTMWEGVLMDITARKQAEEERDRFFTLSLDLLCIVDFEGHCKRLNPAFESALGFTSAEMMATPLINFVHPDDRPSTEEEMEKIFRGEGSDHFVNRFRCRDDSFKWLSWRATAFEGLIYAVAHDITEARITEQHLQKAYDDMELRVTERTAELMAANVQLQAELLERRRTEEALREAQQMLQLVMNHIPQAIFWKDRQSIYLGANYRFAEDAGYDSVEELIGKNDFDMPWSMHAPGYLQDDKEVMETDTVKLSIEEPLMRADGRNIWLRTNKVPLHNSHGDVVGVLASYDDITQQKEAEEALHEARKAADAANLAKSEFLSRMSHELRTPLNAILGFGQLMAKDDLPPLQKESLTYILKAGNHLLDLINEVLDITRVESGRVELSIEPIALADVVPEACAIMRQLAAEKGIRLFEDSQVVADCHVLADRQRIKQVLLNLLANGIKYNVAGGEVQVTCKRGEKNRVQIVVRDSGPGIAPANLEKMFTPFERLDAANSNVEGTGLGLVLSQKLITAMGGTLEVESSVGVGSTFTVELPEAEAPVERLKEIVEPPVQEEAAPRTGRTYSLLCVEDNLSNLRLLEMLLASRPEIELVAAMQGSVGLDLAHQHVPDLILLDLNLPDMSGKEVLARLQAAESTRGVPVIIVSADATPSQIDLLMKSGALKYMTKPLNISEFMSTLREILPP